MCLFVYQLLGWPPEEKLLSVQNPLKSSLTLTQTANSKKQVREKAQSKVSAGTPFDEFPDCLKPTIIFYKKQCRKKAHLDELILPALVFYWGLGFDVKKN